jgi:hypothetical protein
LPYCRRCGTKLDEDAHFCHKCGTPVVTYASPAPAPQAPMKPIRNDPVIIAAIVLSVILVVGVVVAALLSAPFSTLNFNQSYQDNTINVDKLNLNVQTDGARVDVFTQKVNNTNFAITVDGTGSRGMGGGGSPIRVEFFNDTANGVLTVTAKITESTGFQRLNVHCNIYLNPALTLNLNVTSGAGQVHLNTDEPATFESISLQANAGTVQVNLAKTTVAGNINLKAQAGTVDFQTTQIVVVGNRTVDLHSNAGSVNMDITQTQALQGNLQVNAATELGSVNVGVQIDGDVGARIVSQTNLGSIHVNVQHFSGNQSPIQSDNYPASSNIEISSHTNLGSININAAYQSSTGVIRN